MSGNGKEDKRLEDGEPADKRQRLELDTSIPSPSQDTSIPSTSQEASSSSDMKPMVEEPVEKMVEEPIEKMAEEPVEKMEESSVKTHSPGDSSKPGEKSSSEETSSRLEATRDESSGAGSCTSIEPDEEREKITVTAVKVSKSHVSYIYAPSRKPDELLEYEPEDEHLPIEQRRLKQKKLTYFSFPKFNEQTKDIYGKYIWPGKMFYTETHKARRIRPELFDAINNDNINLQMFKEVAKTLTKPPRVIQRGEKRKIKVCGTVDDCPKQVFVNFDMNTMKLITYLLRHIAKSDLLKRSVQVNEIYPEVMYAVLNPRRTNFRRVILWQGHEAAGEAGTVTQEKPGTVPEKVNIREVDTGTEDNVRVSHLYRLSEICKELDSIPHQATRVFVRNFNNKPDYPADILTECYEDAPVVMAKRSEEEIEGEYISLDLESNVIGREESEDEATEHEAEDIPHDDE